MTEPTKATNDTEAEIEPEPMPFGLNLLGITFLSDDWEDDLPLELFLGDENDPLFQDQK